MEDYETQTPIEYSPDKFELTPLNIRNSDRRLVIKKTAYELDKEEPVSLSIDVVKALVSRAISDNIDYGYEDDYENKTIWPESSEGEFKSPRFILREEDKYAPEYKGKYIFRRGLYDEDDSDGMLAVAFAALENLDQEGKVELTKWILKMHQEFPAVGIYQGLHFDIDFCCFIKTAENRTELSNSIIDYLYENADQYYYSLPSESSSGGVYRIDNLVLAMSVSGVWGEVPKYLKSQTDDKKVKRILGIWIDSQTYPRVINQFRKYLENDPSEKLERVGRMLLGENPDNESVKFYTKLEDIYKLIDFEHYPPNVAATEPEVELLMGLIKGGDVVLDKGCGTGRISNALAKRAKEKGIDIRILAFDSLEEYIRKAKEGDETGKVQYFQGNWDNIPINEESVDLIIDVGRNNTHSENWWSLINSLKEPVRVLKKHGKILVDWPDPNKGEYLDNRIKYMSILQSLYIPIDPKNPRHLDLFAYVIDGPDRKNSKYKNVYNRYVPQVETIVDAYGRKGLEMKEIKRSPIVGWAESENIYFLGSKEKKFNPKYTSSYNMYIPFQEATTS